LKVRHPGTRTATAAPAWIAAAILIFAGTQKILDLLLHAPGATRAAAEPFGVGIVTMWLLPPAELVLGMCLMATKPSRSALIAAAITALAFALVNTTILAVIGANAPCRCLGDAIRLPHYWSLVLDGVLLCLISIPLRDIRRKERDNESPVVGT
jgi:hypothetical protein